MRPGRGTGENNARGRKRGVLISFALYSKKGVLAHQSIHRMTVGTGQPRTFCPQAVRSIAPEDSKFRYFGYSGSGFSDKMIKEMLKQLRPLFTDKHPICRHERID
jgi:ATP-dependent DNA ligase